MIRRMRQDRARARTWKRTVSIRAVVRVGFVSLCCGLLALAAVAQPRRRPRHANPSAEISAVARVAVSPRRTTHRNGRAFEEFEVMLLTTDPREPPSRGFAFDMHAPVRIVHDLTCGGTWVELAPGEQVELRGEYVHTPSGRDLIHFTHPADARCGRAGSHEDGYLRRRPDAGAAAAAPLPFSDTVLAGFRLRVRPVLASRCAPCHETGGKMYARASLRRSGHGRVACGEVSRRLKDDDRRALEAWAAEASAALATRAEKPRPE